VNGRDSQPGPTAGMTVESKPVPPAGAATRSSRTEFLRFAAVGAVNTAVYYGSYLAFHAFTPYLAAHAIALVVAMLVSFLLNVHFTYGTRPTWRKFLLYPLGNLTSYAGLTAGLLILVDLFHVDERIAPLLTAVAVVPLTFMLLRGILVGRLGGGDRGAVHPDRSRRG